MVLCPTLRFSQAALRGGGIRSSAGASPRTLSTASRPSSVVPPPRTVPPGGHAGGCSSSASPLRQVQATGRELFQQVCDRAGIGEAHFFGLSVVRSE